MSPYPSGVWNFQVRHNDWVFEKGRKYHVTFSVDGRKFAGDMNGIDHTLTGTMTKEFMHAITAGSNLYIYNSSGVVIANLALHGTTKAVNEAADCTDAMQQVARRSPFGSPVDRTPFASAQERGA